MAAVTFFVLIFCASKSLLDCFYNLFLFVLFIPFFYVYLDRKGIFAGYGLFQDIYAPAIEAILNLGLSVLLGYYYGLPGIITGVLISLLLIVCCWKPYFLYTCGFKKSVWDYLFLIGKVMCLVIVSWGVSRFLLEYMDLSCRNFMDWVVLSLKILLLYGMFSLCVFQMFDRNFRAFSKRIFQLIKCK